MPVSIPVSPVLSAVVGAIVVGGVVVGMPSSPPPLVSSSAIVVVSVVSSPGQPAMSASAGRSRVSLPSFMMAFRSLGRMPDAAGRRAPKRPSTVLLGGPKGVFSRSPSVFFARGNGSEPAYGR